MSTPHRKECLDFQMNNCNFMKVICISEQHHFSEFTNLHVLRQISLPKIQGGCAGCPR
jgi:hypothetical protein